LGITFCDDLVVNRVSQESHPVFACKFQYSTLCFSEFFLTYGIGTAARIEFEFRTWGIASTFADSQNAFHGSHRIFHGNEQRPENQEPNRITLGGVCFVAQEQIHGNGSPHSKQSATTPLEESQAGSEDREANPVAIAALLPAIEVGTYFEGETREQTAAVTATPDPEPSTVPAKKIKYLIRELQSSEKGEPVQRDGEGSQTLRRRCGSGYIRRRSPWVQSDGDEASAKRRVASPQKW
jgi:hypothetical protein